MLEKRHNNGLTDEDITNAVDKLMSNPETFMGDAGTVTLLSHVGLDASVYAVAIDEHDFQFAVLGALVPTVAERVFDNVYDSTWLDIYDRLDVVRVDGVMFMTKDHFHQIFEDTSEILNRTVVLTYGYIHRPPA